MSIIVDRSQLSTMHAHLEGRELHVNNRDRNGLDAGGKCNMGGPTVVRADGNGVTA